MGEGGPWAFRVLHHQRVALTCHGRQCHEVDGFHGPGRPIGAMCASLSKSTPSRQSRLLCCADLAIIGTDGYKNQPAQGQKNRHPRRQTQRTVPQQRHQQCGGERTDQGGNRAHGA